MSDTKVDFAKVNQLLDNGWTVKLFKNQLTTYTAEATNEADYIETDDFTPEQALTRLAYKVQGEILPSQKDIDRLIDDINGDENEAT